MQSVPQPILSKQIFVSYPSVIFPKALASHTKWIESTKKAIKSVLYLFIDLKEKERSDHHRAYRIHC